VVQLGIELQRAGDVSPVTHAPAHQELNIDRTLEGGSLVHVTDEVTSQIHEANPPRSPFFYWALAQHVDAAATDRTYAWVAVMPEKADDPACLGLCVIVHDGHHVAHSGANAFLYGWHEPRFGYYCHTK